ncbi:hypothetical protein FKW77_008341 [Venturia effusa]|uniref:Nudix hydrolase domain-containing protein n=1 Tax=Venturia effusa TaxID=50376 RepID=A0A517LHQ3_9PEZI|nr:hypothetical protein FKW77_008341 [Venturia effusa]
MSSFILADSSPPCRVHHPDSLTKDQLLAFPPFKTWLSSIQHSLSTQGKPDHTFHEAPYQLREIHVQAVDFFGKRRIGFLKLQTQVVNAKGESLPGAVFMRGGSVGMLVLLQPDDAEEGTETDKHAILTIQPRIAGGSLAFAEIPAGMLDGGTFSGGAAKEIEEETGLSVKESELIDMTALAIADQEDVNREKLQKAVYPSPGGCDEYIPLFLYEKRIPRAQMEEFRGKLTGLREEGEKITLKLVPFKDLWKEGARDGKTLAACALYSGLKAEGKL